jgi:hypothetical protein
MRKSAENSIYLTAVHSEGNLIRRKDMTRKGLEREFSRKFPEAYVEKLQKCPFFQKRLKPLIEEGKIFVGIRENTMDFYYRGRRMVRRSRDTYRINQYYLNGEQRKGSPEITCKSEELDTSFEKILKNCEEKAKSDHETCQISKVYEKYAYLSKHTDRSKPFFIDVEARFSSLCPNDTDRNFDKIDLVAFIPSQEALLFVEVKRKKDQRIRSKKGDPEVVEQVKWYRKQIEDRKEILKAYEKVFQAMHELFGTPLCKPKKIITDVPILVVDDPGEDTTDSQLSKSVHDKWLEPKLATLNGKRIWSASSSATPEKNIWLIDGRRLFASPEKYMSELAGILEEVSRK